ncbi:MAG: tRNA uridine(34) 5-carboxymethylaminomethyl modification radical SAM/GNAT enzyme Elp3 [bacterium]
MFKELIFKLAKEKNITEQQLDNAKRIFLRANKHIKAIPRKKDLLKVYHKLLDENKLKRNKMIEKILVKRAIRTLSGVTIVTVLTKPYPCPGQCIYCPSEEGMPKSYISDEPAAARALKLHFDPFRQVFQRIKTLRENGHETDKIELIVKGGSFNAYPTNYQTWFIMRCFQACNCKLKNAPSKGNWSKPSQKDSAWLVKEQIKNEKALHRIIGLTLETRPDMINEKTVSIMRQLGCTRIEMGVQATDDNILKKVKRGHNTEQIKKATAILKNNGLKVDYHMMPQLPGTTPAKDLKMLKEIFLDPAYRPDMIKIYPCTVIKDTELFKWLKSGRYHPYSNSKLTDILIQFKSFIPAYARISRLIRDIPSHHVRAGNKMTNLRQVIQIKMKEQGLRCKCLRCREIGHTELKNAQKEIGELELFIEKYEASKGTEYFMSYENKERTAVMAFCRLRLSAHNSLYPAYIRELHTYGQSVGIGQKQKKASQHKGLGKKMIKSAEKICEKNRIDKLAVISGVGVRNYYRRLNYRLINGYMIKKIIPKPR